MKNTRDVKSQDIFDGLKLCPFCLGRAIVKEDPWMIPCGEDAPKYYVVCKVCGSRTAKYPKQKAIEYWNARKEKAS